MKVSQLISNIDKIYENLIELSEYEERKIKFIPTKDMAFQKLIPYLRKGVKHIDYFFTKASDRNSSLTWVDYHEDDETEFNLDNLPSIVKGMLDETTILLDFFETDEDNESESDSESESENESESDCESEEEEEDCETDEEEE